MNKWLMRMLGINLDDMTPEGMEAFEKTMRPVFQAIQRTIRNGVAEAVHSPSVRDKLSKDLLNTGDIYGGRLNPIPSALRQVEAKSPAAALGDAEYLDFDSLGVEYSRVNVVGNAVGQSYLVFSVDDDDFYKTVNVVAGDDFSVSVPLPAGKVYRITVSGGGVSLAAYYQTMLEAPEMVTSTPVVGE